MSDANAAEARTRIEQARRRRANKLDLNGREGGEDADAEYWLKLIDSFGDESPVIMVLNKIRDHPFDLNRLALQQKYPAIFEEIHHSIPRLHPQEMVPVPEHPEVVVPYEKLLVLERKGLRSLPEVAGGELVELDVQGLLNGVDIEGARGKERAWGARGEAARLFVSYSHKDDTLRKELETHLKLLQRQGLIETWHDRLVGAGDEWAKRIDDNLERADIVLLLVSADFLASDYCYDVEMARALERHRAGEARVIPVIVRDVSWHSAPFAELLALPEDGRAVALWESRDSAWRNVAEKLRETVEAMRRKAGPPERRADEA